MQHYLVHRDERNAFFLLPTPTFTLSPTNAPLYWMFLFLQISLHQIFSTTGQPKTSNAKRIDFYAVRGTVTIALRLAAGQSFCTAYKHVRRLLKIHKHNMHAFTGAKITCI